MADIEERAERAWALYCDSLPLRLNTTALRDIYIDGYMAGVEQTQRDYAAHYESRKGIRT